MKAVILAAGIGSRLRPLTEEIPKCLIKINKKTILEQITENCISAGIDKFVVVVGHGEKFVIKKINDLQSMDVMFELIKNKNYLTTNTGVSLNLGLENLNEDVIIINGDNVFDQDILKKLIKTDETSIVVDNVKQLLEESFKVRINEGSGCIESMGKDIRLNRSNGEFIGISLIKKKDLRIFKKILQKIVSENEQQYYDFAFQEFTSIKPINFVYTDYLKWTEVDDFEDLDHAKKITKIQKLSKSKMSTEKLRKICQPKKIMERDCETWYTLMFFRRISIYFTSFFIRLNISANQVSIIGFLIALLGSLLLLTGDPVYWIVAGLLFHFCLLLDVVDGELARYFKTASVKGHYIDGLLGFAGKIIIIASMFIGLYTKTQEIMILFAGFFAVICTSLYLIAKIYKSRVIEVNKLLPEKNKRGNRKSIIHYFAIPFTQIFWISNIIIISSILDMLFETGVFFRFIYLAGYITATFFGIFIAFKQSIGELKELSAQSSR